MSYFPKLALGVLTVTASRSKRIGSLPCDRAPRHGPWAPGLRNIVLQRQAASSGRDAAYTSRSCSCSRLAPGRLLRPFRCPLPRKTSLASLCKCCQLPRQRAASDAHAAMEAAVALLLSRCSRRRAAPHRPVHFLLISQRISRSNSSSSHCAVPSIGYSGSRTKRRFCAAHCTARRALPSLTSSLGSSVMHCCTRSIVKTGRSSQRQHAYSPRVRSTVKNFTGQARAG